MSAPAPVPLPVPAKQDLTMPELVDFNDYQVTIVRDSKDDQQNKPDAEFWEMIFSIVGFPLKTAIDFFRFPRLDSILYNRAKLLVGQAPEIEIERANITFSKRAFVETLKKDNFLRIQNQLKELDGLYRDASTKIAASTDEMLKGLQRDSNDSLTGNHALSAELINDHFNRLNCAIEAQKDAMIKKVTGAAGNASSELNFLKTDVVRARDKYESALLQEAETIRADMKDAIDRLWFVVGSAFFASRITWYLGKKFSPSKEWVKTILPEMQSPTCRIRIMLAVPMVKQIVPSEEPQSSTSIPPVPVRKAAATVSSTTATNSSTNASTTRATTAAPAASTLAMQTTTSSTVVAAPAAVMTTAAERRVVSVTNEYIEDQRDLYIISLCPNDTNTEYLHQLYYYDVSKRQHEIINLNLDVKAVRSLESNLNIQDIVGRIINREETAEIERYKTGVELTPDQIKIIYDRTNHTRSKTWKQLFANVLTPSSAQFLWRAMWAISAGTATGAGATKLLKVDRNGGAVKYGALAGLLVSMIVIGLSELKNAEKQEINTFNCKIQFLDKRPEEIRRIKEQLANNFIKMSKRQ